MRQGVPGKHCLSYYLSCSCSWLQRTVQGENIVSCSRQARGYQCIDLSVDYALVEVAV